MERRRQGGVCLPPFCPFFSFHGLAYLCRGRDGCIPAGCGPFAHLGFQSLASICGSACTNGVEMRDKVARIKSVCRTSREAFFRMQAALKVAWVDSVTGAARVLGWLAFKRRADGAVHFPARSDCGTSPRHRRKKHKFGGSRGRYAASLIAIVFAVLWRVAEAVGAEGACPGLEERHRFACVEQVVMHFSRVPPIFSSSSRKKTPSPRTAPVVMLVKSGSRDIVVDHTQMVLSRCSSWRA